MALHQRRRLVELNLLKKDGSAFKVYYQGK